jgi:hypothetical protein
MEEAPVCPLLRVAGNRMGFLQENYVGSYWVPHVRLQSIRIKGDHGHMRRPLARKPFGGIELTYSAGVEHISDGMQQQRKAHSTVTAANFGRLDIGEVLYSSAKARDTSRRKNHCRCMLAA